MKVTVCERCKPCSYEELFLLTAGRKQLSAQDSGFLLAHPQYLMANSVGKEEGDGKIKDSQGKKLECHRQAHALSSVNLTLYDSIWTTRDILGFIFGHFLTQHWPSWHLGPMPENGSDCMLALL